MGVLIMRGWLAVNMSRCKECGVVLMAEDTSNGVYCHNCNHVDGDYNGLTMQILEWNDWVTRQENNGPD